MSSSVVTSKTCNNVSNSNSNSNSKNVTSSNATCIATTINFDSRSNGTTIRRRQYVASIALNNIGVTLLQRGFYRDSLHVFFHSLKLLLLLQNQNQTKDTTTVLPVQAVAVVVQSSSSNKKRRSIDSSLSLPLSSKVDDEYYGSAVANDDNDSTYCTNSNDNDNLYHLQSILNSSSSSNQTTETTETTTTTTTTETTENVDSIESPSTASASASAAAAAASAVQMQSLYNNDIAEEYLNDASKLLCRSTMTVPPSKRRNRNTTGRISNSKNSSICSNTNCYSPITLRVLTVDRTSPNLLADSALYETCTHNTAFALRMDVDDDPNDYTRKSCSFGGDDDDDDDDDDEDNYYYDNENTFYDGTDHHRSNGNSTSSSSSNSSMNNSTNTNDDHASLQEQLNTAIVICNIATLYRVHASVSSSFDDDHNDIDCCTTSTNQKKNRKHKNKEKRKTQKQKQRTKDSLFQSIQLCTTGYCILQRLLEKMEHNKYQSSCDDIELYIQSLVSIFIIQNLMNLYNDCGYTDNAREYYILLGNIRTELTQSSTICSSSSTSTSTLTNTITTSTGNPDEDDEDYEDEKQNVNVNVNVNEDNTDHDNDSANDDENDENDNDNYCTSSIITYLQEIFLRSAAGAA